MKRDKGFSMLEVIISIFILSVMMASLYPALIKIYEERATIRQESIANNAIYEGLQLWLFENQLPVLEFRKEDTLFLWSVSQSNEREIRVCLTWSGRNGRDYKKCGYAKK
ncbi:prepilin-type N-terminal cleavage/methylation domain-containing protein [Alkalihalobacterium alkalinitrilicum]|uniref:prepilin-type N-terminal cleavage/methylation domain-containing protein n=1 Tax=Alkalihalobacterium alkalinitrilicum TaxID=427920 RepID=UPI001302F9E5|nr:prepilin-type N-terminal cleavage/methylation domain-containing protein [Alkalihalobacterium alkalinitrilicum]